MGKRRIISLFLCIGLILSGCSVKEVLKTEKGEEWIGLNKEPDLSYEIPVSTPHVLVDQLGYLVDGEKTVVVRGDELPESFEVVNTVDGRVVYKGKIKDKGINSESGERIGYGSFSELTESGVYYVQCDIWGRSYNFTVGEEVYDSVFQESLKQFGTFQDKKINVAVPKEIGTDAVEKIIQGGWYTDEKGNQDMRLSAEAMVTLLTAYELYPSSFIETEGLMQGTSALLGYLKKQADWMLQMQDEVSGGVYGGITVTSTGSGYRLEAMDISSAATYAAAMAKFSYVYRNVDQTFASTCLRSADRAWKYINSHSTDFLQEEERELLFAATAELYRASGQYSYHMLVQQFIKAGVDIHASMWDTYASITYLSTRQAVNVDLCAELMAELMDEAENISQRARAEAYLTEGKENFENTNELLWNMVVLSVADYVITNHEYATVIENHQHFFLGVNKTAACLIHQEECERIGEAEEQIQENILMNAYYICMMSQILQVEQ